MGNKYRSKQGRAQWKIIETKVKDNAVVQVSELPLNVPRYSFQVGTAQYDDETGDIRIGSRLTNFNVEEAATLLTVLAKKYVDKREARISEVEKTKEEALARLRSQEAD